ncbi:MAG: hypothetical protein M1814_005195 [Vezdaea aestivalis]|nr:MAG: hypothetical protein M1814_005195 [Vezdaea aestivalis]
MFDHNDSASNAASSHRRRRLLSYTFLSEVLVDFLLAIVSSLFIVFAVLAYMRPKLGLSSPEHDPLLTVAKYIPSIFPILFTAIVARFLKAVATIKLEHGASIISIEYLLSSRTVFSAVVTPFTLKTINILTPTLILLWALSPLGGQAGLRVISIGSSSTTRPQNLFYLAFASEFPIRDYSDSESAGSLALVNALFNGAIVSWAKTRYLPQDQFGNIRIPIYERLPSSLNNESDWRQIKDVSEVEWTSLTGLPIRDLPMTGVSDFTINTGYMFTKCNVSGQEWPSPLTRQNLSQYEGWSGANYAITPGSLNQTLPISFTFRSLDVDHFYKNDLSDNKTLTIASCDVNMRYVEVRFSCDGTACQPLAIRPSKSPASHDVVGPSINSQNATLNTPISGLAQNRTMRNVIPIKFFAEFSNASNPTLACDPIKCPPSGIEVYLNNSINPLSQYDTSKLWRNGNDLISLRFTQLINTYWTNTIAPFAIAGDFRLARDRDSQRRNYNTDNVIESRLTISKRILVCNYGWFAILLVCSVVLFLASLTTSVLSAYRYGPDVLDRFSSLLRDSEYAGIPHESSIEDAVDQAIRLRNVKVRMGDVKPESEVGYAAIGRCDGDNAPQRLKSDKLYA